MKRVALLIITFYRKFISPVLPNHCRFKPTCSKYGYQAIDKYGVFKGSYMATKRILRCNPFTKGGFDPLP